MNEDFLFNFILFLREVEKSEQCGIISEVKVRKRLHSMILKHFESIKEVNNLYRFEELFLEFILKNKYLLKNESKELTIGPKYKRLLKHLKDNSWGDFE